jgi:FkbM family methyltransferase
VSGSTRGREPFGAPRGGVREALLVAAKNLLFHAVCRRNEARYFARKGRLVRLASRAGLYEPEYMRLLQRFTRPGSDAIDVGANLGAYTHALARAVGPTGRVFAFEPFPAVAAELERSCAGMRNVTIRREVLSDRMDVAVDLHVPLLRGSVPEPSLAAVHEAADAAPGSAERVIRAPLRRLDDYIEQLRDVSVIKVDIEGHEAAFLRGARRTVEAFRPVVQMESHGLRQEEAACRAWAASAGYQILNLRGRLLVRATPGSGFSLNVYLIPVEALPKIPAHLFAQPARER